MRNVSVQEVFLEYVRRKARGIIKDKGGFFGLATTLAKQLGVPSQNISKLLPGDIPGRTINVSHMDASRQHDGLLASELFRKLSLLAGELEITDEPSAWDEDVIKLAGEPGGESYVNRAAFEQPKRKRRPGKRGR